MKSEQLPGTVSWVPSDSLGPYHPLSPVIELGIRHPRKCWGSKNNLDEIVSTSLLEVFSHIFKALLRAHWTYLWYQETLESKNNKDEIVIRSLLEVSSFVFRAVRRALLKAVFNVSFDMFCGTQKVLEEEEHFNIIDTLMREDFKVINIRHTWLSTKQVLSKRALYSIKRALYSTTVSAANAAPPTSAESKSL